MAHCTPVATQPVQYMAHTLPLSPTPTHCIQLCIAENGAEYGKLEALGDEVDTLPLCLMEQLVSTHTVQQASRKREGAVPCNQIPAGYMWLQLVMHGA